MKIKTTEEFIIEAKRIHGDKYDYSKSEFINMNTKLIIICPIHGEFLQTPKAHITQKYGCRKCGRNICANKLKLSTEEWVKKAKEIHGDKYDYSKVNYMNAYTGVIITCKEHGEFEQVPHDHLKGAGCKECGIRTVIEKESLTNEQFITRAILKHGYFYNFDKCDVKKRDENGKVIITCPTHGDFKITPNMFLYGQGCKECGFERTKKALTYDYEEAVDKAKIIHSNKYEYSIIGEYINTNSYVNIKCPIHGNFQQKMILHLQGSGCPSCGNQLSIAENEIYEYCCKYLGKDNVMQRDRTVIKPQELDIYLPTINYAIEYNGLMWHSEKYNKNKYYHLNKLNICKNKDIKLIQIFEDEYINHKDIVLNKIKHILKLDQNLPKIPGRKCIIKEIDRIEAKEFLDKYHIQGYNKSTIYLGSFYNNELIAVMCFKKETNNTNKWELVRFASNYNYNLQGVGSKLFKYFIRNYNPDEIKSFADRRWTTNEKNNIYIKLGFNFDSYTKPEYRYYKSNDGCIRQHKFNFRKQKLHNKYGLSLDMTENEMVKKLGYTKIWDCGLIKYKWYKKEE